MISLGQDPGAGEDRRLANAGFLDSVTQQVLSHLQRYLFCRNTKFATDPMADAHGQTILIGGDTPSDSPEGISSDAIAGAPTIYMPAYRGSRQRTASCAAAAQRYPANASLADWYGGAWKYWVSF